jgi:metal-responsive CopG/Arc/MetJ family transcriptional regulator
MQNFKRLVVLMTVEELAAVDDFRFGNRLNNRSDAVRALLKAALAQIGNDPAKAE